MVFTITKAVIKFMDPKGKIKSFLIANGDDANKMLNCASRTCYRTNSSQGP